jgi:hypothetical protein
MGRILLRCRAAFARLFAILARVSTLFVRPAMALASQGGFRVDRLIARGEATARPRSERSFIRSIEMHYSWGQTFAVKP